MVDSTARAIKIKQKKNIEKSNIESDTWVYTQAHANTNV